MTAIQNTTKINAVSFSSYNGLKPAQQMLLDFLKRKLSSKESITTEDIQTLYIHAVHPNKKRKVLMYYTTPAGNTLRKWEECQIEVGQYGVKNMSLQWFKNNLGACILKGKLLVIPVIEID